MRLVQLLIACMALAVTAPARAQQESVAETLFRAGREALKRGAYTEACAKFTESQRLDPSPGTLLNLAACEERRGRVATAWAKFRELLDTLDPTDPRTAVAREHLAALEPALPALRIRLEPDAAPGVIVRLDDAELSAASQDLFVPIDPGEHRLEVSDSAGVFHRETVTIQLGERLERVLPSKRAPEPEAVKPIEPLPPRPTFHPVPAARTAKTSGGSSMPVVGLALAGTGLVVLGVGAYFGLEAKALHDDSNEDQHCQGNKCDATGFDLRESAVQKADLATGLFVTGAALAAGGLILYFINVNDAEKRRATPDLTLSAGFEDRRVTFTIGF